MTQLFPAQLSEESTALLTDCSLWALPRLWAGRSTHSQAASKNRSQRADYEGETAVGEGRAGVNGL